MEWISVEDRLPEENEQVLITDGSDVFYAYKYYYEGWDYQIAEDFDGEEGVFSTNAMKEKHVTHWMPLPEPPKQ